MVKFSIIGPAVRTGRYMDFYNSLTKNNHTDFEIVFAGYAPPKHPMQKEFKYIFTESSPTCCLEISSRFAQGEYLIICADDCFFSENYLDKMSEYVEKYKGQKKIVGTRYKIGGVFNDACLTFDATKEDSVPLGVTVAYPKDDWHRLGGIDSRFGYALCNDDLQMRFFEDGYELFMTPDVWIDEYHSGEVPVRLADRTWQQGRDLTTRFWVRDGKVLKKRQESVFSFPPDITNGLKFHNCY